MEVDVVLNPKEDELLAAYERLYSNAPTWAYDVAPPIPFVGNNYAKSTHRVLIYASVENLNSLGHAAQLKEGRPMLRSRSAYAEHRNRIPPTLNVHIEPINNGGLLKVAWHILEHLFPSTFARDQFGFLEQVAVANPGKFCIKPKDGERKVNADYAKNWKLFGEQSDYIRCDLRDLAPTVLILPATILGSLLRAGLSDDLKSTRTIVAIRQVQQRAIFRKIGHRRPLISDAPLPEGYGAWTAPSYADAYLRWIQENPQRFNPENGVVTL